MKKIVFDREFILARLIIYVSLAITFFAISAFYENTHYRTNPCPLCGMTRATWAILRLDFAAAYALNKLSVVMVFALSVILADCIATPVVFVRARFFG
jgi:disulfide bond formation protein DsbB